jgi:hypothetical protein
MQADGQADRQIDMLKLVVTFHYSFASSPKNFKKFQIEL